MAETHRDLMAPDTEPTDEELALVMREACEVAMARKAVSDEWMRQQLAEAVREALAEPVSGPAEGLGDGAMRSAAERPRLLIVAGPNGSGKTTITERGLAQVWFGGCEYINPDLIARDEFGDWNSPSAVLSAARAAKERRERALVERRSLAFETVFSARDKVDFVRAAREQGFFVRLFFVATSDPTINAARVARRVMQGGHDVPIGKILSRYFKSIASCAAVAREVDRLYLYDNSVDGREPSLVVRASEGEVVKMYGAPAPWMAPILAQLRPASAGG